MSRNALTHSPEAGRAGVNSIETGLQIARALAALPGPQPLKAVAASAGIPPAKAHRYLVSLIRAGLAEQDRENGHYRLGPLALELGLAAQRGIDVLTLGGEVIDALCTDIDETVLLAVWGNKGPVVVRWEESSRPIATNVRAGWVMPMTSSATGRLFAAYLPEDVTRPLLDAELARHTVARRRRQAALIDQARQRGMARVDGDLQGGISGIAAPAFDRGGGIAAVIAALGPSSAFDASWSGPIAGAVCRAAARLSGQLGFRQAQ